MTWSGFNNLNLSGVEAEQGRKTLDPGFHHCRITNAEVKKTRDGRGHGLVVEFEGLDAPGMVDDFINLDNRNAQAVEIGQRRLKSLLIAANHPNPNQPGDVRSLIGLTLGVHVERGDPWMKDGREMPGGGQPRKSGGAYAKWSGPSGQSQAKPDNTTSGQSGNTAAGGYMDDDIPF